MTFSPKLFLRNQFNNLKLYFAKSSDNRRQFILELAVAAGLALAAGIIFRFLLFVPFSISDQSMSPLLIPGDKILSNRLLKVASAGFWNPDKGDLVVFRHPEFKDQNSIKRIVAKNGDRVEVFGNNLYVNRTTDPAKILKGDSSQYFTPVLDPRSHFSQLTIPSPGDTLIFPQLDLREFDFGVSLVKQEGVKDNIEIICQLLINGEVILPNKFKSSLYLNLNPDKGFDLASMPWYDLYSLKIQLEKRFPEKKIRFQKKIMLNGKELSHYVVKYPCYFALGDNWESSYDSRYFGFLSQKSLIAKPFIIYWSKKPDSWIGINFSRIFKIIS
jgi:signal peptidase I